MKHGRNKYRPDQRGELMLIHQCVECGNLSINRIAADDDVSTIIAVFQDSLENQIRTLCERYGISTLGANDRDVLYKRLYGGVEVPVTAW
jgi:hypothetical protein